MPKYSALAEHAITAKHTTDWPQTKILAFETDFSKRRFLEPFIINANYNVVNSKLMTYSLCVNLHLEWSNIVLLAYVTVTYVRIRVLRELKFLVCSRPSPAKFKPSPAGIWEFLPAPSRHPQILACTRPLGPVNPHPPRTVSVPKLHHSLCVWKPLKTHAVCFITGGNLFSGLFLCQRKAWKNTIT